MKVLSIGNSFSQDAHYYLHSIASLNGYEIETVNLYIGGCSLEQHVNNYISGESLYDMEINGGFAVKKISLSEALKSDIYDYVTLQQASDYSGMYETYVPYIKKLAEVVKSFQPQAKILFHQTWAYETDSTHSGFANYNNSQAIMFKKIEECSNKAAKEINAYIIPVGTVIQKIRNELPGFNYANGGMSLCRDGFHLTYDYGRFTAALVWFYKITGSDVKIQSFKDFDEELTERIINVIFRSLRNAHKG